MTISTGLAGVRLESWTERDVKRSLKVARRTGLHKVAGGCDSGCVRWRTEERESRTCKFWLQPVQLAQGGRFNRRDLFTIETLILQHLQLLEAAWNEHCGP